MIPTKFDLSVSSIGLGAVSVFLAWYLITATVAWYRLRHIPGPFLASFSYLWLAKVAQGARQYYVQKDLCKKYGPLVRIGPNELTTDDPEILKQIPAARSSYNKDAWYIGARFNAHHDSLFTLRDRAVHTERKAKVVAGFAGRNLPVLEAGVDAQVESLLQVIRNNYLWDPSSEQKKLLDFAPLTTYFTMDVISKVAFGEEFGYLKTNSDVFDFLREVRDNWPRLAMAVDVPWIRKVLFSKLFLQFLGPTEKDKKGMGRCIGVSQQIVEKRFAPDAKDQDDLLGSWIRNGLSQKECEIDGLMLIIAGSDTTASAIRITMLYIMTCPQVYQKLKLEIKTAVREGKVSSPISYEEAQRLPYLQAVVYEGLRQRPPTTGLFPKTVPPEGDYIHGKFIPGGTTIGMNISSLFTSTEHFGVDADIFRPERFTQASEEQREHMKKVIELCFGHGRFMCVGKPVAFMELNKSVFELLRHFDFQLANPTKPWDSQSWSVFVEENMWVKVTHSS